MEDTAKSVSPPKARLTFRVGVVGHRPHRLRREDIASLAQRLSEVLSSVKTAVERFSVTHPGFYNKEAPCLRAISPLAEGTDRYFAREALKLGYELCCPLPFHKEEFENDFKPPHSLEPDIDSVANFNNILADAQSKSSVTVFELDGVREEETKAYAAAARVVLNQSDLLIVVWDGGGDNKGGGTYESLVEAIKFAVPVLWIDARAPHQWQLLRTENDLPTYSHERCVPAHSESFDAKLDEVVQHVLTPPESHAVNGNRDRKPDLREEYFAEAKPAWNLFFWWKLFRDFFGPKIRIPNFRVQDFEAAVASDWPQDAPNAVERWANNQLRAHYAWSDKLADIYADKYRSSFVLSYGLGAVVVLLGLLAHFWFTVAFSISEIVVLLWIVYLVWKGNKRRWHDRWMNYRLVAELVRQLRILTPLGGARPFSRLPAHASFGNPSNSWMYWHLRSIDRSVGLPNAKITPTYLKEFQAYIMGVVDGQIRFHNATAERSAQIEHRLHQWGLGLFWVTLAFVVLNLSYLWYERVHAKPGTNRNPHSDIWVIFTAGLPAVGAAVAAINNQGEFARIAKRSSAMEARLRQDFAKLSKYDANTRSREVAEDALRIAQTMVDEVLDWRLVFLDRPLVPPG